MLEDTRRWRSVRRLVSCLCVGILVGVLVCLHHDALLGVSANPYRWALPVDAGGEAAVFEEDAKPARPMTLPRGVADLLAPERAVLSDGRLEQVLDDGATVTYTLLPAPQQQIRRLLESYRLPFAAVVALDPASGDVLAYVEVNSRNPTLEGLARQAIPPAASVFKLVTAAALLREANLDPSASICVHGGRRAIERSEMVENATLDTLCVTLEEALARSTNVAFARWSDRLLDGDALRRTAAALGFEQPIPFDLPVEPSLAAIPDDRLERARAAAGFWHTTMSPLHGALIAAAIANEGIAMRPRLVQEVRAEDGASHYEAPTPRGWKRMLSRSESARLGAMMTGAVEYGTARRGFEGTPELGGMRVAGKTGTLTGRGRESLEFTWFVGFAPQNDPKVALAVMVVNPESWLIRASHVAAKALSILLLSDTTEQGIARLEPGESFMAAR